MQIFEAPALLHCSIESNAFKGRCRLVKGYFVGVWGWAGKQVIHASLDPAKQRMIAAADAALNLIARQHPVPLRQLVLLHGAVTALGRRSMMNIHGLSLG